MVLLDNGNIVVIGLGILGTWKFDEYGNKVDTINGIILE